MKKKSKFCNGTLVKPKYEYAYAYLEKDCTLWDYYFENVGVVLADFINKYDQKVLAVLTSLQGTCQVSLTYVYESEAQCLS